MDKRLMMFMLLASLLLVGNMLLLNWMNPPPAPQQAQQQPGPDADEPPVVAPPVEDDEPEPVVQQPQVPGEAVKHEWLTMGSADPDSGRPFLVTLTNRGAAIYRAELNNPRYRDLQARRDKRGYLGHLELSVAPGGDGALVGVVGPGTPAHKAGLVAGDVITEVVPEGKSGVKINTTAQQGAVEIFEDFLKQRRVGDNIQLHVRRDGKPLAQPLFATLAPVPLELIRPERVNALSPYDPLSMLVTLERVSAQDEDRLTIDQAAIGLVLRRSETEDGALVAKVVADGPAASAGLKVGDVITAIGATEVEKPSEADDVLRTVPAGMPMEFTYLRAGQERKALVAFPAELPGLNLRTALWRITVDKPDEVEFRHKLDEYELEVVKRYKLPPVNGKDAAAHHLVFELEIHSLRGTRQVAYQLDGATGLPTEGWWYTNKIGREWGGVGVRDVAYRGLDTTSPQLLGAPYIEQNETEPFFGDNPLEYIAVDARYFAAALVPRKAEGASGDVWFQRGLALRVGPPHEHAKEHKLSNNTFRLISKPVTLSPDRPLAHSYTLFLGPKEPELLARPEYALSELVYYGWFAPVARIMVAVLHFFGWAGNYGLAIILLTVMVRACMFPLSRKQALNAQKMQELQPEIRRINEKYKKNYEQRTKATRELFQKHNYSPLSGCLPLLVQLPIFIGLYRGLMVDVELRQAPLIPGLSWCSNLAAPDMLFRWDSFMPSFLAGEIGWLGPYFNILPILTIALFILHQKMFMPPPADEQAALQQKMMKFMMVFMGFLFFCVPSGLCIYFIASSLWGIAERKLLPRVTPQAAVAGAAAGGAGKPAAKQPAKPKPKPGSNGNARAGKKKQRKQKGRR